jgi:amino acid transporter
MAEHNDVIPQSSATPHGTGVMVAETELHAGALSFIQVITTAFAHINTGFAFLLFASFIATVAGYSLPLVYIGGGLICLSIAITLAVLAREYPSAAGYFTYISKTLHPRLGFLVAWIYFLYDPLITPTVATIYGFLLQNELQSRWGIFFPWWATTAILIGSTTLLALKGIKISTRVVVVLAFLEILIIMAFGLTGFFSTGPGGFTAQPFTIDPKFGLNGIALGIVLVITAFTGFESVVPLGEESKNPRKYVPWAVVGSVVVAVIFIALATWGLVNGWGINNFDSGFGNAPVGAFFDLAQRYWGGLWILLLLALTNSTFGGYMAGVVVSSRLFFGLGRAGVLPAWFGRVHNHVPRNAILAQALVAVIWAYAIGFWLGADQAFFWTALIITWAVVLIYGSGAVGVFWHWTHERRPEFHWFWHLFIPVAAVSALAVSTYEALPSLTGVFVWTLPITGVWILLGIGILVYFRVSHKEAWLLRSTTYAIEHEATIDELAQLDKEP